MAHRISASQWQFQLIYPFLLKILGAARNNSQYCTKLAFSLDDQREGYKNISYVGMGVSPTGKGLTYRYFGLAFDIVSDNVAIA